MTIILDHDFLDLAMWLFAIISMVNNHANPYQNKRAASLIGAALNSISQ